MYYILIRLGNYRHEILGMFDDLDKAIDVAKTKFDEDGYHFIEIAEIELNKEIEDVHSIHALNIDKHGKVFDLFSDSKFF